MLQHYRHADDEVCMTATLYQRCKLDGRYQYLRCAGGVPGRVLKDGVEIDASHNAKLYVRVGNKWTRVDDHTKIKAVAKRATVKAEA